MNANKLQLELINLGMDMAYVTTQDEATKIELKAYEMIKEFGDAKFNEGHEVGLRRGLKEK